MKNTSSRMNLQQQTILLKDPISGTHMTYYIR